MSLERNTKTPRRRGVFWYDVLMPWATTRQLLFALGALVLIGAIGTISYFSFFYTPASCSDGLQNQQEEGIDCGGECLKLCVEPNITALPSRAVRVAPGVYHVGGFIKNPDTHAKGEVSYEVRLFDDSNILIAIEEGSMHINPGEIAPLFVPNVRTGERTPARTFVDITGKSFIRGDFEPSPLRVLSFNLDETGPRVTATIENQTALSVSNIVVTAFLFNEGDLLVNASQTKIDSLGARERREVVFTWQELFTETPTRVDIIPRITP